MGSVDSAVTFKCCGSVKGQDATSVCCEYGLVWESEGW